MLAERADTITHSYSHETNGNIGNHGNYTELGTNYDLYGQDAAIIFGQPSTSNYQEN